jgi:hypothetical protein
MVAFSGVEAKRGAKLNKRKITPRLEPPRGD